MIHTFCIVDDDTFYADMILEIVKSRNMVKRTLSFDNGQDFVDFMETNASTEAQWPDIILLDIVLPGVSGWEAAARYNELVNGIDKPISLFMSSSQVDAEEIEKAKRMPRVTDFIIKPVDALKIDAMFDRHRILTELD